MTSRAANDKLTQGKINKDEFDKTVEEAKYIWLGE
jgi:hypothetical protein